MRVPFPVCCASAASGAARSTAPVPARNVRRSITGSSRSVEPSLPPQPRLLGQEPLEVLPDLGPVFGCPGPRERRPDQHAGLEPRGIASVCESGARGCGAWGNRAGSMQEPSLLAGRESSRVGHERGECLAVHSSHVWPLHSNRCLRRSRRGIRHLGEPGTASSARRAAARWSAVRAKRGCASPASA